MNKIFTMHKIKKIKKKKQIKDILNAVKSKQREDEINYFGHALSFANVTKNKKIYTRKRKHKKQIDE